MDGYINNMLKIASVYCKKINTLIFTDTVRACELLPHRPEGWSDSEPADHSKLEEWRSKGGRCGSGWVLGNCA